MHVTVPGIVAVVDETNIREGVGKSLFYSPGNSSQPAVRQNSRGGS